MIKNADITLFNAYYNKETEGTEYKRTYLYGVNWQTEQKVTVSDKGLHSADETVIFVPFLVTIDKTFIKPIGFKNLTNKDNYFTFGDKDIVVKGIIDFDITGELKHTVQDLKNTFDDVVEIISVIDNTFASSSMAHWELGCK
ncbi:DUF6751 family protein [Clostridium sp. HBUAS56017]|uniref:DUF6751 family protein n=1 Tax=Clostridium sp. HBUAS56017 TaxID=2571128 RepID=UPI001178AEA3|nr:DUF6751 family protein [Clostridium sp. HBUAS56017]